MIGIEIHEQKNLLCGYGMRLLEVCFYVVVITNDFIQWVSLMAKMEAEFYNQANFLDSGLVVFVEVYHYLG